VPSVLFTASKWLSTPLFRFSSLLFSSRHNRTAVASTLFPDTEASIMKSINIWLSFWTALGSIATCITAWPMFGLFFRLCRPKRARPQPRPDPSVALLKEIADVLKDMRKDQKEALDDLRSRVSRLEGNLQDVCATLTDQTERIVEELRQHTRSQERDVVRIVTQGPWSTLM
jgi:ElaB/YqjD/DUF883 family membrane-anchored ribosome-binding protein